MIIHNAFREKKSNDTKKQLGTINSNAAQTFFYERETKMESNGDNKVTNGEGDQCLPRWTKSPDKEAEFADWKIFVKEVHNKSTTATNATTTAAAEDVVVSYSVHRLMLGLKSDYFKIIFRKDGFSESHKKCSTIELPSPAVTVKQFETLLDYFYTGELTLDSSNAVAMFYFGDYFGIVSLKTRARCFIGKSITDRSKRKYRQINYGY